MKKKIEIINEIIKHHPSYGTELGLSWYTGGMADTGAWHYEKLLKVKLGQLKHLLDKMISDDIEIKKKSLIKETRSSEVITINNSWFKKDDYEAWEKFAKDREAKFFMI